MHRRYRIIIILILAITTLVVARPGHAFDLKKQVAEFTLANGMKWLVVRRPAAPVFSGIVMVRTGGADEKLGRTGIAHLFEHMAFKGSSRLGTRDWSKEKPILGEIERKGAELTALTREGSKDAARIAALAQELARLQKEADQYQAKNEVWEVMMRNGAHDLNAYTSKDITAYHASMPKSRFEFWARVMAEIVFEPAFREFYTERSVVAEERRTSVENSPDGAMSEKLLASAYRDGPYSWSTIGADDDVSTLTIADARAFHERNYVPANMTGVIVGDVTPDQVRAVMERTFGRMPSRPRPAAPEAGKDAGGVEERMHFNAAPSVAIAYHKPTLPDPAEYAFDVITGLLCDGRSSRLEKRLIYDERIARDVSCTDGYPGSRLPNLFLVWTEPLKGVAPGRIRQAIGEEMARLIAEPASDEELSRVRKQVTAGLMYSLDDNADLAEALARFQTIFGNWRLLADYPARIAAVDAAEVQRVAQKYLTDANRVVVERVR